MAQIPMLPMADPARSSQRLRDAPCEARARVTARRPSRAPMLATM